MLGDGGGGSILTASLFSYSSTIGVPAVDYHHGSSTYGCCIPGKYLVPATRYVISVVSHEKDEMLVFYRQR